MEIKAFSKHIKVDLISKSDENDFVHFLSRPMNGFKLPDGWNSVVYTSRLISQAIVSNILSPENDRCIFILEPYSEYEITTNANERILVTLLPTDSLCGNVMYLFKDAAGKKALYTGEFNDLGSILSKLDEIQPVDLVYLDNMITKQSGKIDEACPTVKKIRAKFPNHKIVLRLPSFGYEDLLKKLVFALKTSIGVGSIRYNLLKLQGMERYFHLGAEKSNVYVETNPYYTFEKFSENFAKNLITIEVGTHSQPFKSPEHYEKCGLYQINYSPHPTRMNIKSLLSLVRPRKVVPIFHDGPDVRHITATLCSVKLDDNDVAEVVEINDSGDENDNNSNVPTLMPEIPTNHRKRIKRVKSPVKKKLCPKTKPVLIYLDD